VYSIKKKKILIICIAFIAAITALYALAYKNNFMSIRHATWEVRKTAAVAVLEIEGKITGAPEKPACVPILMYHSVSDSPPGDPEISVATADFDRQMKFLAENGFTALDFNELKDAGNYKRPVIVTFDDGYEDNYKDAYPILKKYNLKATIFMVSGYIGAPGFLSADEMKIMGDLVSFQSHTVRHRPLSEMGESDIEYELSASKDRIESVTNKPVCAISYPDGAYNDTVLKVAPKYYSYAVISSFGYYFSDKSNYKIRRVAVARYESQHKFQAEIT